MSDSKLNLVLSPHFVERYLDRGLLSGPELMCCLRDMAKAAKAQGIYDVDVMGTRLTKKGFPKAQLVGRLMKKNSKGISSFIAITIMLPHHKHNVTRQINTLHIGSVGGGYKTTKSH